MPPVSTRLSGGLRVDSGLLAFTFQPSIGLVAKDFDKLGLDIRSFREPLKRSIQQVLAPSFRKNFDVGGRPRWQPLSSETIEIRQRLNKRGKGILIRTGTLRRVASQLNIWTITTTSAVIKDLPSRIWYGTLQQAGTRSGTANIPARPFIVLQPEDYDGIEKVFAKWIDERATAVNF